jgi:hypothetical protein
MKIHEPDGVETSALETLVDAFAVLRALLPPAIRRELAPDVVGAQLLPTRPLALACTALSAALIDRLVLTERNPDQDGLRRLEAALREEVEGLAKGMGLAGPQDLARKHRRIELLQDVGALIREQGLVRSENDVILATQMTTKAPRLGIGRITLAAAHVWSLDRMFERIECFAKSDELMELERIASAWFFERMSAPGRGGRAREIDFSRGVREQEWSLFDRVLVGQDVSIGELFLQQETVVDDLPSRQRTMASGLLESVSGAFLVERRTGETAIFRNASSGCRYEVHEHSTETRYDAGFAGLGRLIPFGDGRWLRSPGMVLLGGAVPESIVELAEGIGRYEGRSPAIVLEMAISMMASGVRDLPRRVRPAAAAADARALIKTLTEHLRELGLIERVSAEEAPPELRARLAASAPGSLVYESMAVDDVLAEWIAALTPMARSSGSGSGKKKAAGRKRRKKR